MFEVDFFMKIRFRNDPRLKPSLDLRAVVSNHFYSTNHFSRYSNLISPTNLA